MLTTESTDIWGRQSPFPTDPRTRQPFPRAARPHRSVVHSRPLYGLSRTATSLGCRSQNGRYLNEESDDLHAPD